jgi:opacity protein-like surface antigen
LDGHISGNIPSFRHLADVNLNQTKEKKMQKTIVTALALLASVTVASAADLPSKTNTPASPLPTLAQTQYYVGGSIGGDLDKARVYSGGAVAGWNALPFLAVEGTYDVSRGEKKVINKFNYQNTVALNVVPQYKIPSTDATAYVFGGLGYRWNTASTVADHSVYNVGAGLKYEFAKNLEIDGRYTRIDDVKPKFHITSPAEDRVSIGANYKF